MPTETNKQVNSLAAWAPVVIRLVLGIIFIAHGSQLLFGAFGGPGVAGSAAFLGKMGMHPAIFWAWMLAISQFFGGVGLVMGFLTRLAALGIMVDMFVAIALVHWKNGFFLGGKAPGFEYNLALIAMALSLILSGPGALSLDPLVRRWIWKR